MRLRLSLMLLRRASKDFTSFCQPKSPITCANYGNHVHYVDECVCVNIRGVPTPDKRGCQPTMVMRVKVEMLHH